MSVIQGSLIVPFTDKKPLEPSVCGALNDGHPDGLDVGHAGKPSAHEDSEPPGSVWGDVSLWCVVLVESWIVTGASIESAGGTEPSGRERGRDTVVRFGKILVRQQRSRQMSSPERTELKSVWLRTDRGLPPPGRIEYAIRKKKCPRFAVTRRISDYYVESIGQRSNVERW